MIFCFQEEQIQGKGAGAPSDGSENPQVKTTNTDLQTH